MEEFEAAVFSLALEESVANYDLEVSAKVEAMPSIDSPE